ncbi:MAG: DUF885 family protein, partial [Alphaproteobacteria bacterium]|nr:DUF885 family protein [Alphaproteobacteria bacterium]
MRAILFASLSTVLLAAAPAVAAPQNAPQSADAAFKALYTREWAWRMKEFAEDPRANAPVMDHLPKADPKSEQARLVYWQQVMTDLDAIPRGQLSAKNQINYDVYKPQLQSLIDDQRFRDYQMPANSDSAFWTDLDYTARTPFRGLQDYRNWIAQMRDIPRFFAEETQEMRAGLKRGFTPPKVTLEGRDASLSEVAKAKPADTAFYIPFKKLPSTIPAAE